VKVLQISSPHSRRIHLEFLARRRGTEDGRAIERELDFARSANLKDNHVVGRGYPESRIDLSVSTGSSMRSLMSTDQSATLEMRTIARRLVATFGSPGRLGASSSPGFIWRRCEMRVRGGQHQSRLGAEQRQTVAASCCFIIKYARQVARKHP